MTQKEYRWKMGVCYYLYSYKSPPVACHLPLFFFFASFASVSSSAIPAGKVYRRAKGTCPALAGPVAGARAGSRSVIQRGRSSHIWRISADGRRAQIGKNLEAVTRLKQETPQPLSSLIEAAMPTTIHRAAPGGQRTHFRFGSLAALAPQRGAARPRALAAGLVAIACILSPLVGCSESAEQGRASPAGGKPPPAEVGVVKVKTSEVAIMSELPARLEASRVAEVRARAAGIIQKRFFQEGSEVKAGQRLYQIDPAPYQASLANAQAGLARTQATLSRATALVDRYRPLAQANAISQLEFADAQTAQKTAEAEVLANQAAVRTAQINLSHAVVTAPISGRIGRSLVTEGALVGQGITQSANEMLSLRSALRAASEPSTTGLNSGVGASSAPFKLLFEDASEYAEPGRLLFTELTVDATSGQVSLRGQVPNASGQLLPGMYVRVRLEQRRVANAVLLPQQAVTRSRQGDTVMVVAADGSVAPRQIKVGDLQSGQWVVLSGLQAGEDVMVDGFQKLRPGSPVKPVSWEPSKAGVAGAPQSGSNLAPKASAPAAAPATRS
jgi:membrane fusion protein, multidrug efflux system